MAKRRRRKFDPQFKAEAVRLCKGGPPEHRPNGERLGPDRDRTP